MNQTPTNPTPKSTPALEKPLNPHRKRSTTQNENFQDILMKISNEFSDVTPIESLSKALKIHPAYVLLLSFSLLFVPINIGLFPKFFVGLLGFIYPAYMSLKLTHRKNRDSLKQWLTYWVIFGLFELLDGFFMLIFLHILPFFYPIKALFIIWLFYPKSKGATLLYERLFRRLFGLLKELKDDSVNDPKTEDFFKGN